MGKATLSKLVCKESNLKGRNLLLWGVEKRNFPIEVDLFSDVISVQERRSHLSKISLLKRGLLSSFSKTLKGNILLTWEHIHSFKVDSFLDGIDVQDKKEITTKDVSPVQNAQNYPFDITWKDVSPGVLF